VPEAGKCWQANIPSRIAKSTTKWFWCNFVHNPLTDLVKGLMKNILHKRFHNFLECRKLLIPNNSGLRKKKLCSKFIAEYMA